ncbi:MAG: PKD domain-containing protein, partial [Bacteroidia bacterium]
PNFGLPSDAVLCAGYSLQINAYLYSGIAPITYKWYPYTNVTESFVQDVFYQSTRIYLEVTDSTGCSRSDSMDVLVNSIPQILAAGPVDFCMADSMFSLSAISGSASGIWTGPGVVVNGTAYWWESRNKTPGNYTLTFEAQDLSGTCVASENLTVNLYPSPSVDAGMDTGLCGGGPVMLEATGTGGTGGYYYVWNKDTSENKALFFPTIIQDSMHRVLLTDSIGCTATDSIRTFNWPFPQAIVLSPLMDTAVCEGNSVTILADTLINGAGYGYTFSYGIGNGSFVPDSSFTLILHVISPKGCADSVSRRIIRNENPEITSIKGASFCEDQGQIVLDTFASPAGGVWAGQAVSLNNGSFEFSTDSSRLGTSYLSYLLMDTLTGCSDLDSSRMDIEEKTSVDFTADSTHGKVSMTSQFSDLSIGGLKTNYLWFFGDGDSSILKNPAHFYTNPGTYDVSLRIAGNKCVSEKRKVGFIQVDTASGPGIGMDEWMESGIAVYPNPSKRSFVLSGVSENAVIQVYDAQGREIDVQINPLSDKQLELDFFGHPEAVYLLRVTVEDKTLGIRLVLGSGF